MRDVAWTPPERFDEYRLRHLLGRGAMGDVYLADDTVLDRPVAIKFIAAHDPSESVRQRFLVEARAIARLQHPNVVGIYRAGELRGRPYLVSEFVHGQSLERVTKPMHWSQVHAFAIDLARGLSAAHRHGVLHRDIKPANAILTDEGRVKLLDFGIAKLLDRDTVSDPEYRPRKDPPSKKPTSGASTLPIEDTHAAPRAADDESINSGLTQPGALLGTPLYMAPELLGGDVATARSDVYALGVMLYELVSGELPHQDPRLIELYRLKKESPPALTTKVSEIDTRFATIIERCLDSDHSKRFASAEELLEALEALTAPKPIEAPIASTTDGPYRGLHPFDAEHHAMFFGRGTEIRAVVERLRYQPFVLVAGDSGIGKSSLCRGGVLPSVRTLALSDRPWSEVTLTPGRKPMAALKSALASLTEDEATQSKDADWLDSMIRDILRARSNLIIFVDQLEELVTLSEPNAAAELIATLLALCERTSRIRWLATVRSDFLTRMAALPGLRAEIGRALFLLGPLSPESLREVIVEPARAKGVDFESKELVDELIESSVRTSGGLPLLQFALEELWNTHDRKRRMITRRNLEDIGGVEGALGRYADQVLTSLRPAHREVAQKIVMRLVTPERTRGVLDSESVRAFGEHAPPTIDALVRARLVTARDSEFGPSYELAHEALARDWPTLRGWLESDAEKHRALERIRRSAHEWDRLRDAELLFSERQLVELGRFETLEVGPRERAFLNTSKRRLHLRRLRGWGLVLAVALVIGAVALGVSERNRRAMDERVRARLTTAEQLLAGATTGNEAVDRLRASAFERFDAWDLDEGERRWALVKARTESVTASLALARSELESAVALDGTREDVRAMVIRAEMLRAGIGERDRTEDTFQDAVARLSKWDRSGEFVARWTAPARLYVETTPVAATATIAEYARPRGRSWSLGPAQTIELNMPRMQPAGSYLLTFEAPGFAPVRHPILLRAGAEVRISIELLPERSVPNGFVYIPEGEFLLGSDAEESFRRSFFKTAPIHRATTDAFLIAKNETTYAEWIQFVESTNTPPTPSLRRLPSGEWRAEVMFSEPRESITTLHQGRRLPIDQISPDDVAGYLSWLSSTRVPNARLCSEHEWERAARGADGRTYPHGDALAKTDASFVIESGWHRFDVGSHPASRSPFAIDDLAGSLWEIVECVRCGPDEVMVRGGAFFSEGMFLASALRATDRRNRLPGLGLRVCADVGRRKSGGPP